MMKLISKNSSSSHGSSSSLGDVDDGSSSFDDRSPALKEMARERSLVTQLRAVVLPVLQADGERAEVVAQLFGAILDCSAKAMAALKLLRPVDHGGRADVVALLLPAAAVDDKRDVRKIFSGDGVREDDGNAKPHRERKRRRLADDCVTLETPVPHYDGHQWRKYGQKLINRAKHPRSYYRCTYKQEQGCKATKTVQQQEDGGGGGARNHDDPAMYAVFYYGQHTCKPAGDTGSAAGAVETASTGHSGDGDGDGDGEQLARSDSLSQCSNISVICTSAVVDYNHRTAAAASIESNCKLLDMAAEEYLTTSAEVNKSEMFDLAAYASLDCDTAWEMDAHVGGDCWYY